MTPNPEQQAVIDFREGRVVLLSGPGSGKTATLIARYQSLVASGVSPRNILVVTFTKEAANELERRAGKGNFKTFHSYGYSVLSAEKGKLPLDPDLRHRLLFRLTKQFGVDYKELAAYMSRIRRQRTPPGDTIYGSRGATYRYARAYQEYEVAKRAAGWIDFDDMICDTLDLLENPEVAERHQWEHVMADECQDTDDLQFRLLQLITKRAKSVLCVGDPGQSIYMFRGAKPENMTNFQKWFPDGKEMFLGINYRSTHTITKYVRENYPIETPLKEKLQPARETVGVPIDYRLFHTESSEAESAVVGANRLPLDSAILARTNHALAVVENYCDEHSIPYQLLGKSGFWRQTEIARTVEKLKPHAAQNVTRAFAAVMPALEAHYMSEDRTPEDNYALQNVRKLREIAQAKFTSTHEFIIYATRRRVLKPSKKGITLSTVHQAKGTEYRNVYVIGARHDHMPHAKALEQPGGFDEEKRIWFVAISRAIDYLRISWHGQMGSFVRRYVDDDMLAKLLEQAAGPRERLNPQGGLFQ
jgi:superfamily I DNA/RNA helicase